MVVVQGYIHKTIVTGDRKYEERGFEIMRLLAPKRKFYSGKTPTWRSGAITERAEQNVPQFFGSR